MTLTLLHKENTYPHHHRDKINPPPLSCIAIQRMVRGGREKERKDQRDDAHRICLLESIVSGWDPDSVGSKDTDPDYKRQKGKD